MDSNNSRPVKPRPYWSFIALLYSLLGWVLFGAWLFLMNAGFLWYIFAAIPGTTLVIRSARRPLIDRSNAIERNLATEKRLAKLPCVLLFVLGAMFGTSVLNGSFTLLGIIVASFTFAPWARLGFTRNHIALSCLITIGGLISVISIGHHLINFMFLPFAAWAFWGFACIALLFRAEHVQRVKQETTVATKLSEPEHQSMHASG
jgi:hypothetical protein